MRPMPYVSQSQPETLDQINRPQEIVLLEDGDLYKYHQSQPNSDSIPIAQPLGNIQFHQQYPNTRSASSFRPSSDHGSEYRQSSRFQLHATPYALSSVRKPSVATSVDTMTIALGALRPGGSVDLFSRYYIGLLLNWMLVGFFNGSLSSLDNTLFGVYLGYSVPQSSAVFAVLQLPWLFKFAAGFVTDCFPINRQRRKPYIFIGWASFMLFMFAMTLMSEPRPNRHDGEVVYAEAPSQGPRYVISIVVGSFGHLLATVAVEGTMVEFAQREGEFVRGRTQAWCVISRFTGEALGALATALALNSADFGGSFAVAVPLRAFFGFHGALAALGLVVTKFWFHEELTTITSQRLSTQLRRIWSILQKRTTWQLMIFGFVTKIASNFEILGHKQVYVEWLGADTLVVSVNEAIRSVGTVIAAIIFMRVLLNTDWRRLLLTVMALGLVVMVPVDMVTVFDVCRSLTLYLTKVQITSVLDAFFMLVRIAMVIEIAEPGYEAVTYGIFTAVFNLGTMVVTMTKNVVASGWSESITDLKVDTSAVRWRVTRQFFFKYGLRVVGLVVVLRLLPRQKRHLKERNLHGQSSILIPIALFVLLAALFGVSLTSNVLALFESTSCLILAGGTGCKDE